jgi:hypothetical protein
MAMSHNQCVTWLVNIIYSIYQTSGMVAGWAQVTGTQTVTHTRTHETRTRQPAWVAKPVQIPNCMREWL